MVITGKGMLNFSLDRRARSISMSDYYLVTRLLLKSLGHSISKFIYLWILSKFKSLYEFLKVTMYATAIFIMFSSVAYV